MPHSNNETCDADAFETRSGDKESPSAPTAVPRLRVLYHVDLARIGAFSHPELALAGGQWQTVGRAGPLFITPAPREVWRPLADPTISREQLRVRWLADAACFEVEPVAASRRKLFRVVPGAPAGRAEIDRPTRLQPGDCVAVDDRLLLALEVLPGYHGPDEDRLGLVGEDAAVWQLRREIVELGQFRKPVLILGETGTGKELVAGAVHHHGGRPGGPFQTLNCAAMPDTLVESLLFGHTRGAFTGASGSQEGVFKAADGGTLFLDELGEMPLLVQPKLLRTLQDGLVTPLGQHRSASVDVRLVAATNRDPEREVAEGRLRADLYHRIAAHVVQVPPLRARRLDIPALFMHFLARGRHEHPALEWLWRGGERWRATVPLAFFVDMMASDWPGNVRQLENMAERTARRNLEEPFTDPGLPARAAAAASEPAASSTPPTPSAAGVVAGALGASGSSGATGSAGASGSSGTTGSAGASGSSGTTDVGDAAPAGHAQRLRSASRLLGVATRTIAKLLDAQALATAWSGAAAEDDAARTSCLEAALSGALLVQLREHGFAQARVAEALGVSPWTLIRLMQRFDLSRPTELSREQILRALAAADGDLARAAHSLAVSEHGLKKRLAALDNPG